MDLTLTRRDEGKEGGRGTFRSRFGWQTRLEFDVFLAPSSYITLLFDLFTLPIQFSLERMI